MNIENKQQSLLTFRVGPVLCCAPSLPVRSIITPPKLSHPPGSDPSQPGIFKHGSHIVKVFDLRQKFGIEKSEQTQPGNLIITIFEEDSFAFWVDQILDVFDFPSEGWGNLPAAIPRGVFSRTLLLNKKIHLYSEFEKLATIDDLGYLKHYIQQLKKQNTNQEQKIIPSETPKESDKKSTIKLSTPISSDDKIQSPSSTVEKNQPAKEKQPDSITQPLTQDSSLKDTAKKTRAPAAVKIVQKQVTKITLDNKEKIRPSSITSPVSKPHQAASSKQQFKPRINNEDQVIKEKAFSNNISSETTSYIKDETETSSIGIILFLIFILGSLGAGVYYLLVDDATNNYKYKKEKVVIPSELNFNTKEIETLENKYPLMEESIPELHAPIQEESNLIPGPIDEAPETDLLNVENQPVENTTYQADISQLDNEITITVHVPVTEDKQSAEEVITPQQIDQESKDETVLITPPVKTLNQDELSSVIPPEKIINEVIHIVVKGDTLWAIAKKYVKDPFLYPELARLSNIKNPHRIYPGNRVRIRFIKK